MNCPNCDFDSPREMIYCGMCGALLRKTCPSCTAANPLDYRFCGTCGNAFSEEQPAVESQALVTPLLAVAEPASAQISAQQPPAPILQRSGERKIVTVVMTDVFGSTRLLEQVGNEAWVELMNSLLHIQEIEIQRYGGLVDQFRGDGLVALFGASLAHEDDPERAVMAALSMLNSTRKFVEEIEAREGIQLRLRVGINTGDVIVAGSSGYAQSRGDNVMGLAISIASRMENSAEPGTALVSENTYHYSAPYFDWQPLGEITVKGVSEPISVYRPIAAKAADDHAYTIEYFGSALSLVGRNKEFETLKSLADELYHGRGQIALLSGETGIGKSFLVNELRQYYHRQNALLEHTGGASQGISGPLIILSGRCRSYETAQPYALWIDLLHHWLGSNRDNCPKEETLNRLRCMSDEIWGANNGKALPYLVNLLSLSQEDDDIAILRHLDAPTLRQQTLWSLRSWVSAIARQGPVAFFLSDLHWADTPSLEVLKYCLPLTDQEAILWLISYRPERASPIWDFRYHVETEFPHRLTTIALEPLSVQDSLDLIHTLIGPKAIPEQLNHKIIEIAEGNPLYILEIIYSLIDGKWLVQDQEDGLWYVNKPLPELELPESLLQFLHARIDMLEPEARLVLQMAAVIGPVFWLTTLEALFDDTTDIRRHLASLQRLQIIEERGLVPGLGMEYYFKSSLVRDAAYESLLTTQLPVYHRKVAEFIESLIGIEGWTHYEALLAYHYQQAGDSQKELFYTLRAAELAKRVFANVEALNYCNRAYDLLSETMKSNSGGLKHEVIYEYQFEVLKLRQGIHFLMGNVELSHQDARALMPLADQLSHDSVWKIDALLTQPEVRVRDDRDVLSKGLAMAEKALELSRSLADQYRIMNSLIAIASLMLPLGDYRWREHAEEALQLARQLGDVRQEIELLLGIGQAAYGMDDLERAKHYLDAALSICQTIDDRFTELRLLNALGGEQERLGNYYLLLTEYEHKRLQICREIGYRIGEGFSLMFCAQIQGLYLGDYENAIDMANEALDITQSINDSLFPLLRVIQLQTVMGDYVEAARNLERARPISQHVVDEIGRAGYNLVSALLGIHLGDVENLKHTIDLAHKVCQMCEAKLVSRQYLVAANLMICSAYLGLATHQTGAGKKELIKNALAASQAAVDVYQDFGFIQIIETSSEEVLYTHSLALAAAGEQSASAIFLERSYNEMMRKYSLIPEEQHFRHTYLKNIKLHQKIWQAYQAMTASAVQTEDAPVAGK